MAKNPLKALKLSPWYLESPTSFQVGESVILSEERGKVEG